MDPRDGDNGTRYGTQAEMQLPIGTQTRDWQRQARMDMGTRSTTVDRGAYNTHCTFPAGGRDVAVLVMQLSLSPCRGVQSSMVAAVALGRVNSSVSQHRRVDESQWPRGMCSNPRGMILASPGNGRVHTFRRHRVSGYPLYWAARVMRSGSSEGEGCLRSLQIALKGLHTPLTWERGVAK